jgi:hypothetical protein
MKMINATRICNWIEHLEAVLRNRYDFVFVVGY